MQRNEPDSKSQVSPKALNWELSDDFRDDVEEDSTKPRMNIASINPFGEVVIEFS